MSESKVRKQRICKRCKGPHLMTAKELKEHAIKCGRKVKEAA